MGIMRFSTGSKKDKTYDTEELISISDKLHLKSASRKDIYPRPIADLRLRSRTLRNTDTDTR